MEEIKQIFLMIEDIMKLIEKIYEIESKLANQLIESKKMIVELTKEVEHLKKIN